MINAEWHKAHVMLKNPTDEERIQWHIEHAKHCNCRPLTDKLKKEIKERTKRKSPHTSKRSKRS